MIYNSKHKPEQTEIGKHLLDEDDSEDFENLPEFEQSFQTMRADDDALESYGEEQNFF